MVFQGGSGARDAQTDEPWKFGERFESGLGKSGVSIDAYGRAFCSGTC